MDASLPVKRTRESTSKVRTGCNTCKNRRVKCDEGKPTCRKCAIGNRVCEYSSPTQVATQKHHVFTVYVPPSRSQPQLFVNTEGLAYFQANLSEILDGEYGADFWSKFVLQVAHAEPAVQHAVSAISLAYRSADKTPGAIDELGQDGSNERNAAIKSLARRIQVKPNSNLVPLVCCLLFTCIEFLRGHVPSAMIHLQSGFKILTSIREQAQADKEKRGECTEEDINDIEQYIVPIFSRLNTICTLIGQITPQVRERNFVEGQIQPLEDIAAARQELFAILDPAMRFIRATAVKAAQFDLTMDDYAQQAHFQAKLRLWNDRLAELVTGMGAKGVEVNQNAIDLVLIQSKCVATWLAVCTDCEETSVDQYMPVFEEIIALCTRATHSGTAGTKPALLSFDMQLIGPIYYVVLKCRDQVLRRRALELLKLTPRREGLWNAHYAYKTAERVIELEEKCLDAQGRPDPTTRLHGVTLPTSEERIRNMYNMSDVPAMFKSAVPHPAKSGERGREMMAVQFRSRPYGTFGGDLMVTEYITL